MGRDSRPGVSKQTALWSACEWCGKHRKAGAGARRGMGRRKSVALNAFPNPQTLLS